MLSALVPSPATIAKYRCCAFEVLKAELKADWEFVGERLGRDVSSYSVENKFLMRGTGPSITAARGSTYCGNRNRRGVAEAMTVACGGSPSMSTTSGATILVP